MFSGLKGRALTPRAVTLLNAVVEDLERYLEAPAEYDLQYLEAVLEAVLEARAQLTSR